MQSAQTASRHGSKIKMTLEKEKKKNPISNPAADVSKCMILLTCLSLYPVRVQKILLPQATWGFNT